MNRPSRPLLFLLTTSILLISILLTLMGAATAGTPYAAAVGAPPVVSRIAWKAWYTRLLAFRQAECHTTRAATYYFAANGNDSSGSGTIGSPYLTIAKGQSLLAANIRLRFRRGDTFLSATGLTITTPHVTVDDYGGTADPKPILSRFNVPYANGEWSLVPGTANGRCWQLGERDAIAWLREASVVTSIYRKMVSVASVDATPGSWWQDLSTNIVYVNPTGSTAAAANPTAGARYFESVYPNTTKGILIGPTGSVDDTLIQNIRLDGWTANTSDNGGDGIQGYISGTDALLLRGVDVYYSDRHNIVNTGSGGGIVTLMQCKYGWTTSPTSGSGTAIYAVNGGQEAVWDECESWGDMLPSGLTPYPDATYNNPAQLAHSDGAAGHNCALFLAYGCWNRPGQWQAGVPSQCQNPFVWTDLINCRAFVVEETFNARETTPLDASPDRPSSSEPGIVGAGAGGSNIAAVNCRFNTRVVWCSDTESDINFTYTNYLGFLINCTLIYDGGAAYGTHFGAHRNLSAGAGGTLYNCRVHIRAGGSQSAVYGSQTVANNPATGASPLKLYNSIFGAEGATPLPYGYFAVGLGNIAANQINNAYSNASSAHKSQAEGYDQDPFYVEVSDLPFGHPGTDSPLRSVHNQLIQGIYRLEYDADWTPRPLAAPAIGPYEPLRPVLLGGKGVF